MKAKFPYLFQPVKIGPLELKNRIIFPPLATNFAHVSGEVSGLMLFHYRRRAKGGAALITLENACVTYPEARHGATQPRIDSDEFIPGLAHLTQAIHDAGALASVELTHPGLNADLRFLNGALPKAPSAVRIRKDSLIPHELTEAEIKVLEEIYARAALRAKRAGFDLVELQGAHGLLINQFLSPLTNQRTDQYGGNQENRLRFVAEILESTRQLCGEDFPVTIRLAAVDMAEEGISLEQGKASAKGLEKVGLNMIQADIGFGPSEKRLEPMPYPQGWRSYLAKALKEVVSIPVAAVGVIRDPEFAESLLERGAADLVALGRALIADPDWPRKALAGEERRIRRCIGCAECVKARHAEDRPLRCGINAAVGRDPSFVQLVKAERLKKVLVIGGGPAGMEAARVAALRGHRVTIIERREHLGGTLRIAAIPPGKEKINWLTEYYEEELLRWGVEIHLGTEAGPEILQKIAPDVVIIATGGTPLKLGIPGIDRKNVLTAEELLQNDVMLRDKSLVVAGGGLVGCETAEYLAEQKNTVTLLEMLPDVAQDMEPISRNYLLSRIQKLGISVQTNTKLLSVEAEGLRIKRGTGEEEIIPTDYLVLALGVRPDRKLEQVIRGVPVITVGDSRQPGKIIDAVREGYIAASKL